MENHNQTQFSSFKILDNHKIPAGAISKKFMASVFLWMFIALGISTVFAVAFATTPSLLELMYHVTDTGSSLTGLGMFIAFAPFLFVMAISFGFSRLSSTALGVLLLVYAAMMGMSLSVLMLVYTSGSLVGCFASAAVMFGVMALMGYTTDKDLTSFGSLMLMGLVGIIIASMINLFLHSEAMAYVISIVGVAVFLGLTAYDVQKLKRIGAGLEVEGISAGDTRKLAIVGALSLYLDFINLFLIMLRLFGRRK